MSPWFNSRAGSPCAFLSASARALPLTVVLVLMLVACTSEEAAPQAASADPAAAHKPGEGSDEHLSQDMSQDWDALNRKAASGELQVSPAGVPAGLDLSSQRRSRRGEFTAAFRPQQTPAPFNRIHNWVVTVTDAQGQAVEGARLRVDGGMPLHNHGFPTDPKVTAELGGGEYQISGVKFGMQGWWQMTLQIEVEGRVDTVSFDLVLDPQ